MYGYYEYVELTPQQVLQKVSQKQIFEWILGEEVREGRFYKSPLRKDKRPGCRIDTLANGDMIFVDFGDTPTHRSCFSMVMGVHGVTMQSALTLICDKFGLSTNEKDYLPIPISLESKEELEVARTEIIYQPRKFKVEDYRFWNSYNITEQQLKEDRVFAVSTVIINNYKKKTRSAFRPRTLCYAIHVGDAIKLYQPYNAMYKFITNCTVDHVGNINNITTGDRLVVAKAYKDHRVFRNLDRVDTIWFPSENIIPSLAILRNLCTRFKEIVIFFDNDFTGLRTAYRLIKILNSIEWGIARMVYLPIFGKYKDLPEFQGKEGKQDTKTLLNKLKL